MPRRSPNEKAKAAIAAVYPRLRARLQDRYSVASILTAAAEEFPAEPYYRGVAIGIAVAMWEKQEQLGRFDATANEGEI